MISSEENERLAKVGPGTSGGEMLRRYWQPLLPKAAAPKNGEKIRIRILGEDLVLYGKNDGGWGLVREACLHRSASLFYGFVEGCDIRCPYHGWLFSEKGECKERPFERKTDQVVRRKLPAYEVQELGGLLFTYMGPESTKTPLPEWDILTRDDCVRYFEEQEDLDCNWLQVQENAADVTHTFFLHSFMLKKLGLPDASGFNRPLKQYGFQPFPYGLLKSWVYRGTPDSKGWGNMLIFPNALRILTEMHWRVPIDDEHTRIVWVSIRPDGMQSPVGHGEILRQPAKRRKNGEFTMETFMSQDAMACETQGLIADRSKEVLGASDIGVVMFRRMVEEAIKDVEAGQLPLGAIPLGTSPAIDLRNWMGGMLAMTCAADGAPIPSLP